MRMKKIVITGQIPVAKLANYLIAIKTCGAVPVHIEPGDDTGVVREAEGVIIPGGTDIDPALYGEENVDSRDLNKALDSFEYEVLETAKKLKKPVMGVCRGMQLMNVFSGGSMIQNIDNCHLHEAVMGIDRVHSSKVDKDSFLYKIYGKEILSITSAHHQAVKEPGECFRVVQYSDDGVIEGIQHKELSWIGVQWHPERMCLGNFQASTADGLKLFMCFINGVCGKGEPEYSYINESMSF